MWQDDKNRLEVKSIEKIPKRNIIYGMSAMKDVKKTEEVELMTTPEVCKLLRINRYTLYKLLEEKRLHGYKFSNKYMFDRREVMEFLKKSRVEAPK